MKSEEQVLGDIVANNFRAASVLNEAGLDFCCGGNKTLGAACKEQGINLKEISGKLAALETIPSVPGQNFNEWELDFLCDYIVNTHHKYISKAVPDLIFYTHKIKDVHGERHPELNEVAELFKSISSELVLHMNKEENELFPAIKSVLKSRSSEALKTIASELPDLKTEHVSAGGAMDRISQITGRYKVPPDGCNTYILTYKLLKEFEDDLHIHIHLENNILFPKSVKLPENESNIKS